jgi:ribulose-phosphate 3-epimerase
VAKLAPSILNADFSDLRAAIACIEDAADVIHLDVMDGNFVPNISFGPLVVQAIRPLTHLPLDVHLMIARPGDFAPAFIKAGADWVSFHAEVVPDPGVLLADIRERGARPGMVINPATPASVIFNHLKEMEFALVMSVVPGFGGQEMMPETLTKIGQIKQAAGEQGLEIEVEVDGGVTAQNLPAVVGAGADIIVVGSTIFAAPNPRMAAIEIRDILASHKGS